MKRLTAVFLALCMMLSLLGAASASEEKGEAPSALASPGDTEPLLEMTEAPPAEMAEDPFAPSPAGEPEAENSGGGLAEPVSAGAPDEEAVSTAAAETLTVTTGKASGIEAFSATLSMTVTGKWDQSAKCLKLLGFQYCIGPDFSEGKAYEWSEAIYGQDEGIVSTGSGFTFTGPVDCGPSTTYTFRAYFRFVYDDGSNVTFYADNVETFTTLEDPDGLRPLNPGTPLGFDLTGGQSAYFSLGKDLTGFYELTSRLPEGTENAGCTLSVEEDGTWTDFDAWKNPLYLDGRQRYGRVTLNGSPETSVRCSVTLSPYKMTELPSGGTTEPFTGTAYFQLSPQPSGGSRQLTFQITGGTGAQTGSLERWDAGRGMWGDHMDIGDGSVCALSLEDGEPCRLRVSVYGGASCTITVSGYTSVSVPSVRSGVPRNPDIFRMEIPVIGQVPPADSREFLAGIEYTVDGVTGTATASRTSTGELWTIPCDLSVFPGKRYTYRAFLQVLESGKWQTVAGEADWQTYTVPQAEPAALNLGANPVPFEGNQATFLSFTPEEDGWYTFTVENWDRVSFWNSQRARWDRSSTFEGEPQTLNLTAGVPLYIQAYHTREAAVTVEKFTSSVTGFSIAAEQAGAIADFNAEITISASVPVGSSFQAGVMLNGSVVRIFRQKDYDRESWNRSFYVDVLPNTEYTYIPFIEKCDPQTNQAVAGSRVYGAPVTFTTGSFTAAELTVDAPEAQVSVSAANRFFFFTPAETGFYRISVTAENGCLYYWDDSIGGWNSGSGIFSGSAQMLLSGAANAPQYLQLAPDGNISVTYGVKVSTYTPLVNSLSAEAGAAKSAISGFTAEVPVTVRVPPNQYCRVELQAHQGDGNWRYAGSGPVVSGAEGEEQSVTCTMDTFPGRTYIYRVCLTPTDANWIDLPGASPVYSGTGTFTAAPHSAAAAAVLTAGTPVSGTYPENRNVYFVFTPSEAGIYQIAITGASRIYVADTGRDRWQSYSVTANEPAAVRLEASPQYFRLSGVLNTAYTIRASKVESTVTGFTVTSDEATLTEGGLEFTVPVTVIAPIGSEYNYEVQYRQAGSSEPLWKSGHTNGITLKETCTYRLDLPAYPGKTYTYRAVVYDQNGRKVYTEAAEHTVTIPALGAEPPAMQENTAASSTAPKCFWSFTPAKTSNYLFAAAGSSGKLTVLRPDGVWRQIYYYSDGGGQTEVSVRLQANETVYVILEKTGSAAAAASSVTARSVALSAVWGNHPDGQVEAVLETEAAGTYIFAAYDYSGKLLAARVVRGVAGSSVTATLTTGWDVQYVRAFQLDGTFRPQAEAKQVPIG